MIGEKEKTAVHKAARELFDKKGIEQTTLADIASAARLDLKIVKRQYANSSEVLREILSEGIDVTSKYFQKIVNERGKADVRLTRLVKELLRRYEEHYPLFKLVSISFESLNDEDLQLRGILTKEQIDRYRQNTAIIGRLIAQGQSDGLFLDANPLETAYLLRGMINAVIKYWRITDKGGSLASHADALMKLFLKGLCK
jgi:AcrR family transcriptional regulator